jgi:hypothetical protein
LVARRASSSRLVEAAHDAGPGGGVKVLRIGFAREHAGDDVEIRVRRGTVAGRTDQVMPASVLL